MAVFQSFPTWATFLRRPLKVEAAPRRSQATPSPLIPKSTSINSLEPIGDTRRRRRRCRRRRRRRRPSIPRRQRTRRRRPVETAPPMLIRPLGFQISAGKWIRLELDSFSGLLLVCFLPGFTDLPEPVPGSKVDRVSDWSVVDHRYHSSRPSKRHRETR